MLRRTIAGTNRPRKKESATSKVNPSPSGDDLVRAGGFECNRDVTTVVVAFAEAKGTGLCGGRLKSFGGFDHSRTKSLVKADIATSVRELEKDRQGAKVSVAVGQAEPAFNWIKRAVHDLSRNPFRNLCSIPNPLVFLALHNRLSRGGADAKLGAGIIKNFTNIARRGPLKTC
jgi:hypothetical protein